nr:transposase [Orientia tsutsugamushi]
MHYLKGEEAGIYYIDATKLTICHNKRTSSNRVFNKISKIGKSSYGWFLVFKLHLIINRLLLKLENDVE